MTNPPTQTGERRRNRRVVAIAALTTAVLAAAPMASAETVRVFAVGNRIRISDFVSSDSFRDKMFAMIDASYPNRSSLVQAGVDDVASHIQPLDPFAPGDVLVNFPESVALPAAFIT